MGIMLKGAPDEGWAEGFESDWVCQTTSEDEDRIPHQVAYLNN